MSDTMMMYKPEQIRRFQELLINARKMRNLTQTNAAREIGISQTLISKMERGPHPGMRTDELFKVLAFYGIDANEVMELLGYTPSGDQGIKDPRLLALEAQLAKMPDDDATTLLTALEWMLRGTRK